MVVSGQHMPRPLYPPVSSVEEAGWVPQPVWTM